MNKPPDYQNTPPPKYICTVFKQGYVRIKRELDIGGFEETKNRSWSTVYFKLQGTLLQIYKTKGCPHDMYHLSMLKSHCGLATDYLKHEHVLRFIVGTTREQYLLRCFTLPETISWFEHLQSSINISADIDRRRMPRFLTLSRGNNTHRTVTLVVGKTKAIVPVLKGSVTYTQ